MATASSTARWACRGSTPCGGPAWAAHVCQACASQPALPACVHVAARARHGMPPPTRSCRAQVSSGVPPLESLFNGSLCEAGGPLAGLHSPQGGGLGGQSDGDEEAELEVEVAEPCTLRELPEPISPCLAARACSASIVAWAACCLPALPALSTLLAWAACCLRALPALPVLPALPALPHGALFLDRHRTSACTTTGPRAPALASHTSPAAAP